MEKLLRSSLVVIYPRYACTASIFRSLVGVGAFHPSPKEVGPIKGCKLNLVIVKVMAIIVKESKD